MRRFNEFLPGHASGTMLHLTPRGKENKPPTNTMQGNTDVERGTLSCGEIDGGTQILLNGDTDTTYVIDEDASTIPKSEASALSLNAGNVNDSDEVVTGETGEGEEAGKGEEEGDAKVQ